MSAYIDYCIAQLEADLEPSDFEIWWAHEKELRENIIDSD